MAGSSDRVVPAIGGVLAVPGLAVGSVGRFQPESAQAEITQLREMQDWLAFLTWVELQLKTTARQALAVHTTTACQPKKAPGPAESLVVAGMDSILTVPAVGGGNQYYTQLDLANAYEAGDDLRILYTGVHMPSPAAAEKHTCIELLGFLLISAPERVVLHPSNWLHGDRTVEELRAKAGEFGKQHPPDKKALASHMLPGSGNRCCNPVAAQKTQAVGCAKDDIVTAMSQCRIVAVPDCTAPAPDEDVCMYGHSDADGDVSCISSHGTIHTGVGGGGSGGGWGWQGPWQRGWWQS